MQNIPLVSVIMSVYNAEKYLKDSVESILNQTLNDFEFIIINDGSTDDSEEIVLSYKDSRIVYIRNGERIGLAESLNKAISYAKGRYIARMDADDISFPERLEEQVAYLKDNNKVDVLGTWIQYFGNRKGYMKYYVSHEEIKVGLLLNVSLAHPTIMARREFYEYNRYNPAYGTSQDYELWIRTVDDWIFANIPKILLKYRIHPRQTDSTEQIKNTCEVSKMFLQRVGCDFSDGEVEDLVKFLFGDRISLESLNYLFENVLKSNKKTKYLDEIILKKILGERFCMEFWKAMFIKPSNMISSFNVVKTSSMNKYLLQGLRYCSKRAFEKFCRFPFCQ